MNFQDLTKLAFAKLSRRPHSTAEVKKYLSSKTSDAELVERVIAYLIEKKFLNDPEFAAWLVASRSRTRPRGLRLIKQELKQKGLSEDAINTSVMTADDETSLAKQALNKKAAAWKNMSNRDFRIKAQRFLITRGFSWSAIEKAIKFGYNEDDVNPDY